MELRHLRYFVAVAEEGSVTRAAARLGIQQPPLSQQIRGLEQELGVTLFERTARTVRLNSSGTLFLRDAQRLLAEADEAVHRLQRMARGEQGQLLIGFTSSAAIHPAVPRLLQRFCAVHPLVQLVTREDATRDLLQAVDSQEIDFAFVRSPVGRYPDLDAIAIDQEAVVAALPAGHALAEKDGAALPLAALADEDFVSYRRAGGPGIHDILSVACGKAGFEPRIVAEVPRLLSAVIMVAAGSGVSLVPRSISALHRKAVAYRRLDAASAFSIPLNLAFHPRRLSRVGELFLTATEASLVSRKGVPAAGTAPRPAGPRGGNGGEASS